MADHRDNTSMTTYFAFIIDFGTRPRPPKRPRATTDYSRLAKHLAFRVIECQTVTLRGMIGEEVRAIFIFF